MNIEKVTSLSNVQKKVDNFSQIFFLKNNKETNKQEQNISLNPKKFTWTLCMERPSKQHSDYKSNFSQLKLK